MKRKNRLAFLVLLLIVGIGIGYAALTSNLKILGQSGIKSGKWIIYFDKIRNESGVVSTETKITNNKTQVDFNIQLSEPGDYYEFDVDTVNDGTIDAMIESTEFGSIDPSLKDIIKFDVTYKDGTKIKKCDVLPKESRKAITVKVYYKLDISEEQIIDEEQGLNLTFTINYVQNTECDNRPTLVVDPNGGSYNDSTELTRMLVEKNSDTILDQPTREGYEFLYFKASDGTELTKDANGKTTVHVDDSDEKVTAYWQEEVPVPKYTLTIDPNGGFYNAYDTPTTLDLAEGETLTLEDPIRDGYIFDSWEETTETSSLDGSIVTMPALAVTVRAVWKTEADYVARIEQRYYTTIQKAFDAAVTNDKVWLLKSTTENATNVKDISFDLGGFTVTGTITNSGTLTIDNGKITNTESSPFVNTGTVNVGTKGGEMLIDSIIIDAGRNVNGLTQNGTFNFYDGHIIGQTAVTGIYNELEEDYYYIVDGYDDDNTNEHWQKAYLIYKDDLDAIVKKVIDGKDVYYKLLQDAVDQSTNQNPYIYAIKNFPDSHETTIHENDVIVLDIAGFTVEEGASIINNGTLTLLNSDTTKGSMSVHEPLVNNGTLTITDLTLSQVDTGKNLIENSGDLNITNSILSSASQYTLNIKNGGDLVFDNTTEIRSGYYGIHNVSPEPVTITGGNIVGILNEGSKLTVSNVNISRSGNSNYQIYSNNGEIYLNNISQPYEYYYGIIIGWNTTVANITGGTYLGPVIINGSMTSVVKNANMTYIELSAVSGELINNTIRNSGVAVASDGNLTITSGTIESTDNNAVESTHGYGTITVNGGTITGKRNAMYDGTIIVNGGTITSDVNEAISTYKNLTINGGTINSLNSNGIKFWSSTMNITGGTITGKNYGVYITSGTATIGNKETALDITKPVIRGELYGLYIETGVNCNFYDGILKGKTRGFYGSFKDMRPKHMVFEGTEEIDGENYKTAYPKVQDNYLEVNNVEYNYLQDAIDAAGNEGTIKVIRDAMVINSGTIPVGADITLNLNGKTILNNDTITNNGKLTILDNTNDKLGKLQSEPTDNNHPIIINNGIINIKSGNFESLKRIITTDNSNAEIKIEGGNFTSNQTELITINNYKKLEISGGVFESKSGNGIINSSYYVIGETTISGGEFINNSPYSYSSHPSALTVPREGVVTGGTFISYTGNALVLYYDATIENATVRGRDNPAILYSGGNVVINDVDAKCTNSAAIDFSFYDTASLTINGGTYISENLDSFTTGGPGIQVNGGTFIGKRYGLNGGNGVTLGSDTNDAPILKPVFIGETSGANIVGKINYYDGIFKGKDSNYIGEFQVIPDDYIVTDGTEVIDGETYNTAYLTLQTPFLQVGSNTYSSLRKAVAAITDTGTITVIGNGKIAYTTEIPAEKDITIDLNGHTIRTVNTITNLGTLTIKDSSGNNSGKIYNSSTNNTILNRKNLTIESGTYEIVNSGGDGAIINQDASNSNLIINNGVFNSTNKYALYKSAGSLTINDGEFNSTHSLGIGGSENTINGGNIYTTVDCTYLTMNGGTIETSGAAISSRHSDANVTINGGYIHSTGYTAIWFQSNLTVTGGTIESDTGSGIYTEGGTLTLGKKDGTIENPHKPVIIGKTHGVYLANSQPLYFYDGIMKGELDSFFGVINEFEVDSIIAYDEEVVDENTTLQTAFLVPQTVILHNEEQNKDYKDMNLAFQEVQDNETLTVIDDAIIYDQVSIPNKKLTLDLNNHKVVFVKDVTNAGEITVLDDTSNSGYITMNKNNITITNNNIMKFKNVGIKDRAGITNNSELYFDNVTVSEHDWQLVGNKAGSSLEIKDSNINASAPSTYLITNEEATIDIKDSTINSRGMVSNNKGTLTIDGGEMTSTNNLIYSYGVTGKEGSLIVKNNAKLICTTGDCVSITNNGKSTADVKNTTLTNGQVANGTDATIILNTINHTTSGTTKKMTLSNSGTMTITDYTINSTLTNQILSNSGMVTINNLVSNTNFQTTGGSYSLNLIENSGTCNFNSGTISMTSNKGTIRALKNTGGTFNLKSGTLEVLNSYDAYGIDVTGGEVIIGTNEDPTSLSTTDPVITAIGTNSGTGINKSTGQINYYDGKITGSTIAIPQAPTAIPNGHRIILQSLPNDNNYDIRILENVSN